MVSVDVLGQFARKQDAQAWLSAKWMEYAELRLAVEGQWDALKQERIKLRDFEKRCVEALGRSNKSSQSLTTADLLDLTNREIRGIVRRVVGNKPSGQQYQAACVAYSAAYTDAWRSLAHVKSFLKTLTRHQERYYAKFGKDVVPSELASYVDVQRDEERFGFVDAFFEEREMPGHNLFICPVCESIHETSYVDARCNNFDCSRYSEPLWTWESFQAWKAHGELEADGIGHERYEYELSFGWTARQERQLELQADLNTLAHLSPKMREIVKHASQDRKLLIA